MKSANRVTRKEAFHLPDNLLYFDGNSLGPLPRGVAERVQDVVKNEWGEHLITGWNVDNWMAQPIEVANRVGRLIGAPADSLVLGDTLSVKVYQALSAAVQMSSDRRVILSDSGNFPSDLYMADGLVRQLGSRHELRLVEPEAVLDAITDEVAVLLLTQVDYRTGRMHDMAKLTRRAQEVGAVVIWDLAHSAGAVPVDLAGCNTEFAVGCTYKYMNGGPGAPAFIYARPDIIETIDPALCGWLGHEAPFAFDTQYRPAMSIERMRVGTPPVIQIAALDAALNVWDDCDMADVRAASVELCELFITLVESQCPTLRLASPRNADERGSQVCFGFENGFEAMQALIARGVIGDFRAPDIMRFGITPLYIDEDDVRRAVAILAEVINDRLWDNEAYRVRGRVT